MMKRQWWWALCLAALCLSAGAAKADLAGLAYYVEGGDPVILAGSPDYDWWYGCSPTSAGMMMGYYDIHGYGGRSYGSLIPGGVAETSSYGNPSAIANHAIASAGHQYDFYSSSTYGTNTGGGPGFGYGISGDDRPAPHHSFNSLADFMGTSQDNLPANPSIVPGGVRTNVNGATTFWSYTDGSPLTYLDSLSLGLQETDGMYGIGEYVSYAGYGVASLYTQATSNNGSQPGFTFANYMAEISAGRVVMLHVSGHSMFGYGYDATGIFLHDTWSMGEHYMAWGGSYSGMDLWGVTVLELSGGEVVPVPAAVLLGLLGLGVAGLKLRREA